MAKEPLTADEAQIAQDITQQRKALGALIKKMRAVDAINQRWVSIGATDLQTGFMALERAINRPDHF